MSSPLARVTIIGDGAMGTLCALLLSRNGSRVTLWGRSGAHVDELSGSRENKRYLPGHKLPASIVVTNDADRAFDEPTVVVSAVPCQFIRRVWEDLAGHAPHGTPILSVAKGLEIDTLLRPTEILRRCLGAVPVACLSGPNIAPEIAMGKPAGAVVASQDVDLAKRIQSGFSTSFFRVYTSRDVLGVELAGAVKNVVAIAAGISDGIRAGDNAKAALVTRGLVEITRLGAAMGASPETFRGLAGMGDLITTCISKVGRNRSAGEQIGHGQSAAEVIASTHSVIEGIPTTRSVLDLAKRHNVEMPIVEAVARVLFEGQRPADAIEALMTRPLREEASW